MEAKRLSSLLLAVSLLISWALSVVPAGAQDYVGRVGAFSLPKSPWDVQWTRFRESVTSSGLELEYFIRGEIGSEEAMLAALKRNRLQVAGISLQGLASVVPELNVALAPFLFESAEEVDFVYDDVLLDITNELLEPHGLLLMRWLESGWFSIGSQTPIRTPSDLDGLRIGGSPNVAIQGFLRGVGADSVPIASVDLVQALDTGLVDGAIKPTALVYSNLRERVKHVTLFNVAYDTGGLVANRTWFEGLSDTYQTALRNGHGPSADVRQEVRDMVTEQLADMSQNGPALVYPVESDVSRWIEAGRAAHPSIVKSSGDEAQRVYDAIISGLETFRSVD